MKTTTEKDPAFSGARLVWQMLREEKTVFVTSESDMAAARVKIDRIFEEFERVLQRSLPRPAIVTGDEETEDVTETIGNDPFFQKLKRIDERRSSTPPAKARTPVDEERQRQWMNRVLEIAEKFSSDFILDVSGRNGGRSGTSGNTGTIRVNANTLHEILNAAAPAQTARVDLQRGRWLLIAGSPFHDMNELVDKAIVFWETLAKSIAYSEST